MVIITSNTAKDMYYANLIYEIHKTQENIRLFEKKYGMCFKDFEEKIKTSDKENFEEWDDYIDWKACEKTMKELFTEKEDIERGNFKVS